ncbi:AGAP002970-PA-like protein [Anopheles sinensis]|uniref:AGAP002970-PA-like protein n=1 Tax=Anopheles sinensis TaxID=74873 RepID=A0A084VZB3_ANOSI|nr:AGAP002970-PA-like protein [Anopheles sinensis]
MSSAESAVYEALMYACSQDAQMLKPAEQKLAEWEIQPGFHLTLVKIFSDQTLDANVRWMASLYFKNGVLKYWRKNAPNGIAPEEKQEIKQQLLLKFNEPVQQIAVQIAVLIGNISRYDGPTEWQELVPTLVKAVQSEDSLVQYRGLLVLLHVVKVLYSKRLQRDRHQFQLLTSTLYDFVLNLWDGFTQLFFKNICEQNCAIEECVTNLEKATISLRILKKLTIYGFTAPHQSESCMMLFKVAFQRLKDLLECRLRVKRLHQGDGGVPPSGEAIELARKLTGNVEKFIVKHMKFMNLFYEQHPASFVEFVPTSFEFCFNYVFHEGTNLIFEDNVITFPNFAIQCLGLLKGILSQNIVYVEQAKERINSAKVDFFTPERLTYIFEKIIVHYFLLTPEEFEQWDTDPEAYTSDEGGDSWKYNLRACAEAFYMILFQKYSPQLIQELQKYISKSQSITLTENSDLNDLLIKDSIYNATGLAVFSLFDEINFDEWFTQQLLDELKFKSHNFRIIRKRIIWLVGRWTSVRFSKALRPQVYRACLELLHPTEDLAVRLTASKTLRSIMDDFEFVGEQFVEFLEPAIALLFALLKEAVECETKMTVLHVMTFIIEKMSMSMRIDVQSLVHYLPLLWEESRDHNMLRCAIISTLLQIIKALYEIPPSEQIVSFIYQIIEMSTNVNEPSHVYLLDEGLELWVVVVHYSRTMNQELASLCENIVPLIQQSSSNMPMCLAIVQAYIFLDADQFLPRYGPEVVKALQYVLTDLRVEGVVLINRFFLTLLHAAPKYGIELLRPYLVDVFRAYYQHSEYPQVQQVYLQLISRVLINDQVTFSVVLSEVGAQDALEKILTHWLEGMHMVTRLDEKKLLALALGSLLPFSNEVIFENFGGILTNITETLNDIMNEDEQTGTKVDALVLTDENDDEIGNTLFGYGFIDSDVCHDETPHFTRCRSICLRDPTHVIVLKDYLQNQLIVLKNNVGAERYQSLMSHVDLQILKELSDFVVLGIDLPASGGAQ